MGKFTWTTALFYTCFYVISSAFCSQFIVGLMIILILYYGLQAETCLI